MTYDIEIIKRKMLIKFPFFGSVITNVDYIENTNIKTAGTDGKNIYFNPNFLSKLNISKQIFIFAHEVCHIAFNHILRSEGKDKYTWNTATDGVINAFLIQDDLEIPENGIDIKDAINYDAEELYEKLLQEKQKQQQQSQEQGNQSQQQNGQQGQQGQSQNQSSQGGSREQNQQEHSQDSQSQSKNGKGQSQSSESQSGQGDVSGSEVSSSQEEKQDVGHDTHSMWEDAIKKHKEDETEKNNQEQNELSKKQKENQKLGEKNSFKENLKIKKENLEKIKDAMIKESVGAGNTTNENTFSFDDIGRSKPLLDWRYILKENTKFDVDWSYKNATIEDGVISANLEEISIPETEILLDTSSSVNDDLLKSFLKECINILKFSKIKVGCFDIKFYGFKEIRNEEDIENMVFYGRGGTDFNVAANSFSKRVDNKIIFTDGDATVPKKEHNIIWIVYGGEKIHPKGGKVIYVDENELINIHLTKKLRNHSI